MARSENISISSRSVQIRGVNPGNRIGNVGWVNTPNSLSFSGGIVSGERNILGNPDGEFIIIFVPEIEDRIFEVLDIRVKNSNIYIHSSVELRLANQLNIDMTNSTLTLRTNIDLGDYFTVINNGLRIINRMPLDNIVCKNMEDVGLVSTDDEPERIWNIGGIFGPSAPGQVSIWDAIVIAWEYTDLPTHTAAISLIRGEGNPVWSLVLPELYRYRIDVDAVTGEVLLFESLRW